MKKLTLALAATAIAATCSTFVTTAQAGGRGRLHFHLHQLHLHQQRQAYRDDDDHYVRRKKKVVVRHVVKYVEKPAPKAVVAVAKYADSQGGQYDLASNVWFDGKGQCWSGNQAFTFKNASWSYGDTRWIESSAGWGVASGTPPVQVSCDGIKAFEAKLKPAEIKPVAVIKDEPKVETIEKAEAPKNEPVAKAARLVGSPPEVAAKTECKKYFPSVGEMVAVPCGE